MATATPLQNSKQFSRSAGAFGPPHIQSLRDIFEFIIFHGRVADDVCTSREAVRHYDSEGRNIMYCTVPCGDLCLSELPDLALGDSLFHLGLVVLEHPCSDHVSLYRTLHFQCVGCVACYYLHTWFPWVFYRYNASHLVNGHLGPDLGDNFLVMGGQPSPPEGAV